MKENLTAAQQAHKAAKARLDYYNIQRSPADKKAVRYTLRKMDANGRAISYVCELFSARDVSLRSEYIGVFYEHTPVTCGDCGSHVRIDFPDGQSKYMQHDVRSDADWQTFARMAGVRNKTVIDLIDTEVAGVRRISFTVPSTLKQFTIHVAPLR